MNLQEIRDFLRQYQHPQGRLELLLVQKDKTRYFANRPNITNRVQHQIVNLLEAQTDNFVRNTDLEEVLYNPSGQLKDEYSVCNYDYVGNFHQVIQLFENHQVELLDPEAINFMIVKLRVNQENEEPKHIYFF